MMENQLFQIVEKAEISNLLFNYFRAIDEKQLDKEIVENTFTSDAKVIKPNGAISVGPHEILEGQLKSFLRFKATQHVCTDFIIEIANDSASIRTNLSAMHVWGLINENPSLEGKHFHAGGVLTTKAIKVEGHWRISEWIFRNTWRSGDGLNEMAKFARPS
ncbi:hypothetical protein CNR22_19860 [Sphingobacteriaceae bacterium]|nr:hypothetical protein CNR22_19860 [Sphingobacteriaceae bacterium]